jgi:hypothetical protein
MKTAMRIILILLFIAFLPLRLVAENQRVQLTLDTSEADKVLEILSLREAGKSVTDADWNSIFNTEPYQRLKVREQKIADQFNAPANVLKDEDFQKFVLSDDLLKRAPDLRATLERWKAVDLQQAATHVLEYLPESAVIHARVYPVIKPHNNSFVWEPSTNPAIFLYLDPDVSPEKFTNTVTHELHHIGLSDSQKQYEEKIKGLPEQARTVAQWIEAFGEGMAMLAAAGGPDVDPQAASKPDQRDQWKHDLANFNNDLPAVNAFFLDVLNGKLTGEGAIDEKGSSFFGAQGPWYTVGYKMAVMVEKRFGRGTLIQTMLDPRQLLSLYNKVAAEQNAHEKDQVPLWSPEILKQVQVPE